jgi:hypothetical protein
MDEEAENESIIFIALDNDSKILAEAERRKMSRKITTKAD